MEKLPQSNNQHLCKKNKSNHIFKLLPKKLTLFQSGMCLFMAMVNRINKHSEQCCYPFLLTIAGSTGLEPLTNVFVTVK